MEQEKERSLYQRQKQSKPTIEALIENQLEGEQKANARRFVSFVKSCRMTPQWASANSYAVSYKGKRVCHIKVWYGTWYVRPAFPSSEAFYAFMAREKMEECLFQNIHDCVRCGSCAPGTHETILGREFDHVCHNIKVEFHDPDDATLDCIETIVDYRRGEIRELAAR